MKHHVLVIDNYDSFTYNLVQYLGELGARISVFRNDKIDLQGINKLGPDSIVISPGPGEPRDAGISNDCICEFGKNTPILGVCLGHQCVGYAYGGTIVGAKVLMHGKTSEIYHNKKGIFRRMKNPFVATRYHSLIVEKRTLPAALTVTAQTADGEIMGLQHKKFPVWGVQFHPESILTAEGKKLLENFLEISK
ncbi:MAG: aminodeoxychorismate/anthranilate synthase component II [Candidatus Omnitrophota bacterium]